MDFRNAYAQGFARVAACTLPVALADPAANAERVIATGRGAATTRASRVALFPELCLSGYAIDDLLMQDALLEAVDDAVVTDRRGHRRAAAPSSSWAPRCGTGTGSTTARSSSTAARCSGSRRSRSCPTTASSTRSGTSPPAPASRASYRAPVGPAPTSTAIPFGPDLLFRAEDLPDLVGARRGLRGHVGAGARRATRRRSPARPCCSNLSGSPITVAAPRTATCSPARASARCNAAYLYAAASAGESSTDLSWDGMTMVYEMGDLLGESERFPDGPAAHGRRRRPRPAAPGAACGRAASATTPTPTPPTRAASASCRSSCDPPTGDLGLRRKVDRFPFVPDDEARLALDCYEAYNIQVSGLEQRMRAIGGGDPARMPKIVIGVSGGLDSTHALIVAAKAMDRLGRPRTRHPRLHDARASRRATGTKSNAIAPHGVARHHLGGARHPPRRDPDARATSATRSAAARRSTTSPSRTSRPGCAPTTSSAAANQRGGIVLGTGDLSELALGWCTYGVGDQMSHYGVNTGVPKTLMQHLIRWVVSSAPVRRGRSTTR